MAVKLYDEERAENTPKPTYVRILPQDDGYKACAVDAYGSVVAVLYRFDSDGLKRTLGAHTALEKAGHDTSFTRWNTFGQPQML